MYRTYSRYNVLLCLQNDYLALWPHPALSFLLSLPLFVPAFKQLDDQIFLLLFGKVFREKPVYVLTLNIELFFLIWFFLGKYRKNDVNIQSPVMA